MGRLIDQLEGGGRAPFSHHIGSVSVFSIHELYGMLKKIVIEEIVEENVVSSSGKYSRLLVLEWPGMEDSNVEIHYEKLHIVGDIYEKVHDTVMDDDLLQQDNVVDWKHDPYHIVDEQQQIIEIVDKLNHPGEEVFFQANGS
nr:hypothetical protein [Tanacetum cinerariifolium]